MVNLYGPGAFGSARPSATRPAHSPLNAPGDQDDWFKDCSSPEARDGTEWRSALLNKLIALQRSVVRKSGQPDDNLDDDLITRAIRSQKLSHVPVVGGTANALTVTLDPVPADYTELSGCRLILVPAATNTGAATITFNGLAAIPIQRLNGAALQPGDLVAGAPVLAVVQGSVLKLLAQPNMGVTGSLASAGWTRLPNGLLMQWGQTTTSTSTIVSTSFPIAFPTSCFLVVATDISSPVQPSQGAVPILGAPTAAAFDAIMTQTFAPGNALADTFRWIALGH